jgi:hypothetical protein
VALTTTPTDFSELYDAIAGLGDITSSLAEQYRGAQSSFANADQYTKLVPQELAQLLATVAPARAIEEGLHDAINAPDPIDPVAVFSAYQPLFQAFSAAQDTFNAYTGYQVAAVEQQTQGEGQMTQFIGGLADLKIRIAHVNDLFQDWTPPDGN